MEHSNSEVFERLRRMYVPGKSQYVDRLMNLCRLGMEKKPNDPLVRELLLVSIQLIVNVRDRTEIDECLVNLAPLIMEALNDMTEDDLRVLSDHIPHLREPIARMIFFNGEVRRSEEQIREIAEKLDGIY